MIARRIAIAAGTIGLLLGAAAGYSWLRSGQRPAWFRPPARGPELALLGERFERRVSSDLSDAHPFGTPWELAIDEPGLAAWLNSRLGEWAANQGSPLPSDLRTIHCSIDSAGIRLGASIGTAGNERIIGALVLFDSAGRPSLHSPSIGRLVPPEWAAGPLLRLAAPGLGLDLSHALGAALPRDAPLQLGDGRRVRLIAAALEPGVLRLTCVTEGKQ